MQQKVGVGEDRLLRQLRKLRVAPGGLARRVATRATGAEEQLATFSDLGRRGISPLRNGEKSDVAGELGELVPWNLLDAVVFPAGGLKRRAGTPRSDPRGQAHVFSERRCNLLLDGGLARFPPEAAEHTASGHGVRYPVCSTGDAITVEILGIPPRRHPRHRWLRADPVRRERPASEAIAELRDPRRPNPVPAIDTPAGG